MFSNKDSIQKDKHLEEMAISKFRNLRINLSAASKENGKVGSEAFYSCIALGLDLAVSYECPTIGVEPKRLVMNPYFICGMPQKMIQEKKDEAHQLLSSGSVNQEDYDKQIKHLDIFYNKKTDQELLFLLKHELGHIVRESWNRKDNLGISKTDINKHSLLNIAQDYVINNGIAIEDFKGIKDCHKALPFTEFCYMNEKYLNWTTEDIYFDLLKQQKEQQEQGGSGRQGQGKYKFVLDEHFDGELSEEEQEAIGDLILRAAKQAGQEGTPSDIWKMVEELTRPKVSWKKLLDKQAKSMIMVDYTYANPHVRSMNMSNMLRKNGIIQRNQGIIYPRIKTEGSIKVIVGFDTSGSISNKEKADMLSEVVGIMNQFPDYELVVFCWGSQIVQESIKIFTPQNVKEAKNYQFLCGGGTVIQPTVEFMTNYKDHQKIVFTDGYIFDKVPSEVKGWDNSIWVLTNRNSDFKTPVGKLVFLEDAK